MAVFTTKDAKMLLNVYVKEAIPRAYQEDKLGNLDLDRAVSSCGSKGCLLYWMAVCLGIFDRKNLLKESSSTIYFKLNTIILESNLINVFEDIGFSHAFSGSHRPLEERQKFAKSLLKIYQTSEIT
jgi:hypothetical protein